MSSWRRKTAGPKTTFWLLVLGVLGGCSESGKDPGLAHRTQGLRQSSRSFTLPARADLALDQAEVVLEASWGAAPGQLGRRQEASQPGPMSLTVGEGGDIFILDQINRRVCRFSASGSLRQLIPLEAETTEEISLAGESLWALVYQPGAPPAYRLERYQGGTLRDSLPLSHELAPLTGLFTVRQHGATDVWVEVAHDRQLRVVREGQALPAGEQREAVLGRPLPGKPGLRLTARRTSPQQAAVIQVETRRQASVLLRVTSALPLLSLHQLAADSHGRIFLGLEVGRDGGLPAHQLQQVQRLMVVRWPDGGQTRVVELAAELASDRFRDTAVGPDGAIYQLQTQVQGATLRRWRLPLDETANPSSGGAR